jgi:hypothetical protein
MSDIISGGVKSVYNTFISLYEFSDLQTDGTWLARNRVVLKNGETIFLNTIILDYCHPGKQ